MPSLDAEKNAHIAESALLLLVERPQTDSAHVTRPMIARRNRVKQHWLGADEAQLDFRRLLFFRRVHTCYRDCISFLCCLLVCFFCLCLRSVFPEVITCQRRIFAFALVLR